MSGCWFTAACDGATDLLTVSETATEPPQEEGSNLNSPKNLSLEATFVNHNFSQQVLKIVSQVFVMIELWDCCCWWSIVIIYVQVISSYLSLTGWLSYLVECDVSSWSSRVMSCSWCLLSWFPSLQMLHSLFWFCSAAGHCGTALWHCVFAIQSNTGSSAFNSQSVN